MLTGCLSKSGSGVSTSRTSPALVVSVQGDDIVVGEESLQTAAMISDARGVMGAVVGLGYDPLVSAVRALRPADLPASCLWEKNEGHGTVCVAVACERPLDAGSVSEPRSLATLIVHGRQEGSTAIEVSAGSCQEDTCLIGTDIDESGECLGTDDAPITVAAARPNGSTVSRLEDDPQMGPCTAANSVGECNMSIGATTSGPFSQESMR